MIHYTSTFLQKRKVFRENNKKNTPAGLDFTAETHIIDISDLRNRIAYIQSLEKLEYISRLCEHEFSDVQIESRVKKFQSGFLKMNQKNFTLIFSRLLFSEKMYVADIDIDKEAIKESINAWRIEKGYRKEKFYYWRVITLWNERQTGVLARFFILRENKLFTLRDLFDNKEPLLQFLWQRDYYSNVSDEYYSTDNISLRNFKNLLRQHLIEKCKSRGMEWVAIRRLLRFRNRRENPSEWRVKWKGKPIYEKPQF